VAFPPQFLDEIRTRISVSDVVGRRVKLTRRGREFVGLSPFNPEKTPSFTVNDQKGFYHCFSSGEHGDIFAWVMRMEGLSFPKAVERLAADAGLEVPKESPAERQQAERRAGLHDVVEAACVWFQERLYAADGREALAYLRDRGLGEETIRAFRLGYAPDGGAFKAAMAEKGIDERLLIEAGLLRRPDDGRPAYPFFRGRILFPIADRRGRVIAFGGRFMGDHKAAQTGKYINSPDTPLFDKGRSLYNLDRARPAAHKGAGMIVAEGYMDVIALAQAGFGAAVAPLGTAMTEEQISLVWRHDPEPVLCFDGDEAGRRAAGRAAERALPLLKPGATLQFAFLPGGEDPDSLLQVEGAAGMQRVLERSLPLADVIWAMEVGLKEIDTPERKADLEKRLMARVGQIGDQTVRSHYQGEFRDRLWQRFRARKGAGNRRNPPRSAGRQGGPDQAIDRKLKGLAGSHLRRQHIIVLTTLINHPRLMERFGDQVDALPLDPDLDKLRRRLQNLLSSRENLDLDDLSAHFSKAEGAAVPVGVLDTLTYKMASFSSPEASDDTASEGLESIMALQTQRQLRSESETVRRQVQSDMPSGEMSRLRAIREAVEAGELKIAQGDDS